MEWVRYYYVKISRSPKEMLKCLPSTLSLEMFAEHTVTVTVKLVSKSFKYHLCQSTPDGEVGNPFADENAGDFHVTR